MIRRRKFQAVLGLSLIAGAAQIVSCSHDAALLLSPLTPVRVDLSHNIQPMAVSVGVYYGPDLLSYGVRHRPSEGRRVSPVGRASEGLLDAVFAKLFEVAIAVPDRPPLTGDFARLRFVIEPRIESFHLQYKRASFGSGTFTVEITYLLTLYSRQGDTLASWTVQGQGSRSGLFRGVSTLIQQAAELSLQDAGAKILIGFRDEPAVQRWLEPSGLRGADDFLTPSPPGQRR